jgi:hypothetical protein
LIDAIYNKLNLTMNSQNTSKAQRRRSYTAQEKLMLINKYNNQSDNQSLSA